MDALHFSPLLHDIVHKVLLLGQRALATRGAEPQQGVMCFQKVGHVTWYGHQPRHLPPLQSEALVSGAIQLGALVCK
jgi:hypothetical protein